MSAQRKQLMLLVALALVLALRWYWLNNMPPVHITIASSNTKEDWLNAVIANFNAQRHTIASGEPILVQATYDNSGDLRDDILNGDLQPTVWSPGELSFVEEANEIWRDRTQRILASENCPQTALAPAGLAMWQPMAEALGWPDTPIGWGNLIDLMVNPDGWESVGHREWGAFKFGHTHPDYSDAGRLMLTSLAYFATGNTSGLTGEDVRDEEVREAFRLVEINTDHYGHHSRDLLALMAEWGPDYLHAVTTTEAETRRTNADPNNNLRYPLVFIALADGTHWSEHPYCVLDADWVTDQQKEAAAVFLDYLLDPAQQALAIGNHLRPVDESVPLPTPRALESGTDPRVAMATVPRLESPSAEVARAVSDIFLDTKKPAAVILLLDASTSMNGDHIKHAIRSTIDFVELMDGRDTIYVFSIWAPPLLIGEAGLVSQVREFLTARINGMFAREGTALYDAVCQAITLIDELRVEHDDNNDPHLYGIVLLSDGKDENSSYRENQMLDNCLASGESVEGVRVFTIAYGEDANFELLDTIATRTDGKSFTALDQDLEYIYRAISTEQ